MLGNRWPQGIDGSVCWGIDGPSSVAAAVLPQEGTPQPPPPQEGMGHEIKKNDDLPKRDQSRLPNVALPDLGMPCHGFMRLVSSKCINIASRKFVQSLSEVADLINS